MGTNYYRLRSPITHLRLEESPGHDRLTLWVNHANAGTITLRNEETHEFILGFVDKNEPIMYAYWSGFEQGTVVRIKKANLLDKTVVISEYGEVLTVAEVKACNGANRRDRMPKEEKCQNR